MNNLVLLLVAYVFFLILALFISRADIVSPSILFFGSFCVMFLIGRIYQWFFRFSVKTSTFWIVLGAGAAFISSEYIYKYIKHRSHRQIAYSGLVHSNNANTALPITISERMQYVFIAFMLIAVIAAYYRTMLSTSGGTWGERIHEYEVAIHRDPNYTSSVPLLEFFVLQTTKLAKALVHVLGYLVIYNKVHCGVKIRQQGKLVLAVALYVPLTILQGGRQGTVELIIFCVLIYVMFKKSKKRLRIIKFAIVAITILAIGVPLFSGTTVVVGGLQENPDAMLYVATYLCGGFKNFDELIVGNPYSTKYFGQSTFGNLYSFMIRHFHVLPQEENLSYHAGGFFGDTNITIFGRWYEDFGAAGVIIMTILVALFFARLHDRAMTRKAPSLTQIVYVQQSMALVLASYDDRISALISVNNVIIILLMLIVYRLLIGGGKYRFVFRGKRIRFKLGGDHS